MWDFIFFNPYNAFLAQNGYFKEKGKHKGRPVTGIKGNRWSYKYFRYHRQVTKETQIWWQPSSVWICICWWLQCTWYTICIILPNFKKQFMIPAKLQPHFHMRHIDYKDKVVIFLNINVMNWSICKLIWHQPLKVKVEMYVWSIVQSGLLYCSLWCG